MKKQNKRNQFTRITLALLLILSMLGNTLIFPAVAQETVVPADEPTLSETPTPDEADAASTPTLPDPIRLTAADIPEFISAAALEERGAVERMRSEETNMSSVIFRNSDGTRTMYMYGLPVKYTAMDGTVRDKSTNLVSVSTASVLLSNQPVAQAMAQMSTTQRAALQEELGILDAERAANTLHILSTALTARGRSLSDMAYTTLDNDVYALFPTHLTEGMTLVFGEHSICMTPATGMTMTTGGNVTKTTTSSLSDTDVTERLLYPNVFGPGTAVQYTPTLTGIKEEILLSHNVGKNSFDFLLETDGLVLTEINGLFVLINPETEQQVGKLGEIIVFDSAGQIARGQMTAQTILAGQKYRITISVDQEFLASATYPVSIDPTVYMDPVKDDYEYGECVLIEDVGIYSHEDAWGWTFEDFHVIGDVSNYDDHVGAVAYRFPLLYDPDVLSECYNLTSDQIYSFRLQLATYANENQAGNTLYANLYKANWDSDWRICDPTYYSNYDTTMYNIPITNIPESGTFYIDLTPFAREWADMLHGVSNYSGSTPSTGVLIRNADISKRCVVYAAGHTYQMHAVIDYGDPVYNGMFYFNNLETRKFMGTTDNSTVELLSGQVYDIGNQIAWKIAYHGENMYSLHPNGNMNLYLDGYADIMFGAVDCDGYWNITLSPAGGVILTSYDTGDVLMSEIDGTVIAISGNGYTNYEKSWRMVSVDNYEELRSMDTITNAVWLAPQESYDLYNNLCLNDWDFIVAEDFECILPDTTIISSEGNLVTGVLPSSSTMIEIKHKPTGLSTLMSIHTTAISEGAYFIKNVASKQYLTTRSVYSSGYVDQDLFLNNDGQTWLLSHNGDGTYTIQVKDSNYVLTTMSATQNNGEIRTMAPDAAATNRQTWYIELCDGNYLISPVSKGNSDFVLAVDGDYAVFHRLLASTTDDEELWELIPYKEYTVTHYVDNGFVTRFGNDYENKIQEYHDFAVQKILNVQHVRIKCVIVDGIYESSADKCKEEYEGNSQYLYIFSQQDVKVTNNGYGNYDEDNCDDCKKNKNNGSGPCPYHDACPNCISSSAECLIHATCPDFIGKDSYITRDGMAAQLHQELLAEDIDVADRDTYVIWTGHIMSGTSFRDSEIRSASYSTRIIVMTTHGAVEEDNYYTTKQDCSYLRNIFVHELSHQFGAEDHYCHWYDSVEDRDPSKPCPSRKCYICKYDGSNEFNNCVMKESSEANISAPYCAICEENIGRFILGLEE